MVEGIGAFRGRDRGKHEKHEKRDLTREAKSVGSYGKLTSWRKTAGKGSGRLRAPHTEYRRGGVGGYIK